GVPVYCLAGNHDFVDTLHSFLPRPGVFVQRTLRVGGWLFLFGDSNEGGADLDPDQGWIDRPDRLHEAKGGLTGHEVSWLDRQLGMGGAEHVMLWLHHPPGSVRFFEQPDYDHQVAGLVSGAPTLRAMSAGHAHTACTREVGGIPSHVCPSTGLSVDLEEMVLMPPGYRRFQFWPDGSINTEVVWVDDERWNERHSLPQIAAEYLAGLVTAEDLRSELGLAPDEGWRGV
ncbi:MAG: hypothetical protein GY724_09970, partial [Actinomycetia bacterium]|nr:hypothetical protein [Actinomycetes bacterium]